jgi:GNAT superfamily N-acetyltransferase
MNHDAALSAVHSSLRAFYCLMGHGAPTSRCVELDGVLASIVPETPERSLFNSVVYDRAEALYRAHADLDRRYQTAGVRAWTVWLMPGETAVAAFLEQHGHKFDGAPIAMALELGGGPLPVEPDLDWSETKNLGTVATINEEAYGMTGSSFRAALRKMEHPGAHFYVARIAGEPASCVMTLEIDNNCGLYCVATLPNAQRHGLSGQIMAVALNGARARGCTTATVQATPMGYNVFRQLGFTDLGKMAMWELRR